jgi:hypothetical protein
MEKEIKRIRFDYNMAARIANYLEQKVLPPTVKIDLKFNDHHEHIIIIKGKITKKIELMAAIATDAWIAGNRDY